MKRINLYFAALLSLLLTLGIMACGSDETDTTTEGAETVAVSTDIDMGENEYSGVWMLVTENGSQLSSLGLNSLIVTLTDDTFTSEYDGTAGVCTWSGTYTSTESSMTWVTTSATGPPCDQAMGQTKTAQASLSPDGRSLTMDWTANEMGTLQVYERVH